jgi:hypothetical protein
MILFGIGFLFVRWLRSILHAQRTQVVLIMPVWLEFSPSGSHNPFTILGHVLQIPLRRQVAY